MPWAARPGRQPSGRPPTAAAAAAQEAAQLQIWLQQHRLQAGGHRGAGDSRCRRVGGGARAGRVCGGRRHLRAGLLQVGGQQPEGPDQGKQRAGAPAPAVASACLCIRLRASHVRAGQRRALQQRAGPQGWRLLMAGVGHPACYAAATLAKHAPSSRPASRRRCCWRGCTRCCRTTCAPPTPPTGCPSAPWCSWAWCTRCEGASWRSAAGAAPPPAAQRLAEASRLEGGTVATTVAYGAARRAAARADAAQCRPVAVHCGAFAPAPHGRSLSSKPGSIGQ